MPAVLGLNGRQPERLTRYQSTPQPGTGPRFVLTLADDRILAIHALPLRPTFYDLPSGGDLDG